MFRVLDPLGDQVQLVLLGQAISHLALDEGPVSPGVDGHLELRQRGLGPHEVLGEPLDLTAAFVPVPRDDPAGRIRRRIGVVDRRDHRVDPALLAQLPGLHDLVVGEVVLQERGDVDHVACMGVTVDEVAAADEPADLELADPARGQSRRTSRSLRFFSSLFPGELFPRDLVPLPR